MQQRRELVNDTSALRVLLKCQKLYLQPPSLSPIVEVDHVDAQPLLTPESAACEVGSSSSSEPP